jgi:hypothetical protein
MIARITDDQTTDVGELFRRVADDVHWVFNRPIGYGGCLELAPRGPSVAPAEGLLTRAVLKHACAL